MSLVSIIIVNWNAKEYLKGCIDSILSQTFTDYEIILVDNASSDDSVVFVEDNFPEVKIIKNNSNIGFAGGNNIGIEASNGKIIALLNPDTIVDKDWLSILINVMKSSEKISAVTGKMYYLGDKYGKNTVFCTWSKVNPYSASPYNFHDDEPISKVDYLSGAAMIIKKDVLGEIGLMDPDYFLYFEETDLCARMIRSGYDLLYVPSAIVWHEVSPLSNSIKKIYYMERSRIRFTLKNFDSLYIFLFLFIFLGETLYVLFRDIKNRNFSRTKTRFKAIWWNLVNFKNTLHDRQKYLSIIRRNGFIQSYNKNLPLRSIKIK
jgi:hypothetical protein